MMGAWGGKLFEPPARRFPETVAFIYPVLDGNSFGDTSAILRLMHNTGLFCFYGLLGFYVRRHGCRFAFYYNPRPLFFHPKKA